MEQHMKSYETIKGGKFLLTKNQERGDAKYQAQKKGKRSGNYINNFAMKQREFLMINASTKDKKFEIQ